MTINGPMRDTQSKNSIVAIRNKDDARRRSNKFPTGLPSIVAVVASAICAACTSANQSPQSSNTGVPLSLRTVLFGSQVPPTPAPPPMLPRYAQTQYPTHSAPAAARQPTKVADPPPGAVTFQDTYIGQPFDDFETSHKKLECERNMTGRILKYHGLISCANVYDLTGLADLSDSVGGITATVIYNFGKKNNLFNIIAVFQSADYARIKELCVKKWCSPDHSRLDSIQNGYGTRYKDLSLLWNRGTVEMSLQQYTNLHRADGNYGLNISALRILDLPTDQALENAAGGL